MAAHPVQTRKLAEEVEEVATELRSFRDKLPRDAAHITTTISKLFAISALLRETDQAEHNLRDDAVSYYSIRDDVDLLVSSLHMTTMQAFDMLGRSYGQDAQVVWDRMKRRMSDEEGLSLLDRLVCYRDFLADQQTVIQGYHASGLQDMRRRLRRLRAAQEASKRSSSKQLVGGPGASLNLKRAQGAESNCARCTELSPR